MGRDAEERRWRGHDGDDVEIVEVVGFERDGEDPARATPVDGESDEVDVVFDDGPSGPAVAAPEGESDRILRERFVRLQAEFDNFRKRREREQEDALRHASTPLLTRLLSVLDNFDRALAAPVREADEGAFRKGVALIHRQLLDELQREGLRTVGAVGHAFDPSRHDAVETDRSGRFPHNVVVEEIRPGYMFRDRLLRPAEVRVSVSAEQSVDGGGPTEDPTEREAE